MARETRPEREARKAQEELDEKAREAKRALRASETPQEKQLRRDLSASKKQAASSEQDAARLAEIEQRSLADDPPRCTQPVDVPTPTKVDVFGDESDDSTGGGAKKQLAMGPSPGESAHERGVKFVTTASGSKFPSHMLERTPGGNPVPKELLHKPRLELSQSPSKDTLWQRSQEESVHYMQQCLMMHDKLKELQEKGKSEAARTVTPTRTNHAKTMGKRARNSGFSSMQWSPVLLCLAEVGSKIAYSTLTEGLRVTMVQDVIDSQLPEDFWANECSLQKKTINTQFRKKCTNNYAAHRKAVVNGFNKVFCSVLDEKTAPFFKEKAGAPPRFPDCFIDMGEPMAKSNENAKANKDLVSLISNGNIRRWIPACGGLSGDNVEKYEGELEMYNEPYMYIMVHFILKSTDLTYLAEESNWKTPDGTKGASPFDACWIGRESDGAGDLDLLTGSVMQYFDLLFANIPWFQGTNVAAFESVNGCAAEHNSKAAMKELKTKMEIAFAPLNSPANAQKLTKRRRLVLEEDEEGV